MIISFIEFCTPWPEGLETDDDCREHFPLEFVDCDVLLDGPSIRDDRARKVTLKVRTYSKHYNTVIPKVMHTCTRDLL